MSKTEEISETVMYVDDKNGVESEAEVLITQGDLSLLLLLPDEDEDEPGLYCLAFAKKSGKVYDAIGGDIGWINASQDNLKDITEFIIDGTLIIDTDGTIDDTIIYKTDGKNLRLWRHYEDRDIRIIGIEFCLDRSLFPISIPLPKDGSEEFDKMIAILKRHAVTKKKNRCFMEVGKALEIVHKAAKKQVSCEEEEIEKRKSFEYASMDESDNKALSQIHVERLGELKLALDTVEDFIVNQLEEGDQENG